MNKQMLEMLRALRDDRRASVSVLSAVILIAVIGLGGMALQEAILFEADMQLKTGADMAALAGARQLSASVTTPSVSAAIASANTYTASNQVIGQSPSASSGYPQTKCLTSTGVSCTGSGANAVVVKNQVTLNLLFVY